MYVSLTFLPLCISGLPVAASTSTPTPDLPGRSPVEQTGKTYSESQIARDRSVGKGRKVSCDTVPDKEIDLRRQGAASRNNNVFKDKKTTLPKLTTASKGGRISEDGNATRDRRSPKKNSIPKLSDGNLIAKKERVSSACKDSQVSGDRKSRNRPSQCGPVALPKVDTGRTTPTIPPRVKDQSLRNPYIRREDKAEALVSKKSETSSQKAPKANECFLPSISSPALKKPVWKTTAQPPKETAATERSISDQAVGKATAADGNVPKKVTDKLKTADIKALILTREKT